MRVLFSVIYDPIYFAPSHLLPMSYGPGLYFSADSADCQFIVPSDLSSNIDFFFLNCISEVVSRL